MSLTLLILAGLGYSSVAMAHSPIASDGQDQLAALLGALVLAVFWLIYLVGARRSRPAPGHWLSFQAATVLCIFAALGPLDQWAETSAAAHMTQHMLFMVVIAPLWVLARPLPQITAGGGALLSWLWRPMLRLAQYPMLAAWVHGTVIWFWHMPRFYILALENPWWHLVEHALFIVTALVFWWAVLKASGRNAPWALLALLFTLVHTGFLGAILTFASAPLYGDERVLASQQLAGLIMWVLGAIPYLLASAWLGARWYRRLWV